MLQLILFFDSNVPTPLDFHWFVVMPAASWGVYPKIIYKLLIIY